ncbi:metallophosphoesterase [Fredinandcohnia sp. 179-A 10B2 NHS]|uniref:metallophosphoesterase n=1 Tax=Fredinandcohnia sp. 179-A 10B2 NHS TaxID=3235176 RepID=UPI00399EED12
MEIVLLLVAILVSYFLYRANKNTYAVTINKISVSEMLQSNSQPQTNKMNVLHLSDLHLENLSISPEELFKQVKNEKIDLIAVTGDFLDRKRSIPKLLPYLEVFKKIAPTFGTFAVFGNHDYVLKGENFQKLKKVLNENGCKTLQNQNETVFFNGHRLNIIGIDDFSTKRSNLGESYSSIQDGYNLVLTHDPNLVLHMEEFHFDYLLSGHFHGGQICYPKPYHLVKMGKLVRMNMIKGFHIHHGKPFYINEGLGQTGVNIRVRSNPEITIHELPISDAKVEKQVI